MSFSLVNGSFEKLPISYTNTFLTVTNLIKCTGLDIFGESLGRKNLNSSIKLACFNIMFIPFLFMQLYLIYKIDSDDFKERAAVVPMNLMFCLAVIMMIVILSRRDEIREIFLEIGDLWPKQLEDGEKGDVMRSWTRQISVLVKSFYSYSVMNAIGFMAMPLVVTGYSHLVMGADVYILPFHSVWKINSIPELLLTYLWQILASLPCVIFLYEPFFLLIVVITCDISFLLRVLHIDLKNAVRLISNRITNARNCELSASNRVNEEVSYENCYAEINRVVIVHQRLMRVVAKLNSISGLVVLILVTIASVFISLFGFLTVICVGMVETTINVLTVFNAITVIFLLSFSGQLLCDTSSGIADAAYDSLWYETNMKVKKLVLLIIVRSQQPCYLSALGFSDMCLRSFTAIMRSAWGYFTLLVQLYEDQ